MSPTQIENTINQVAASFTFEGLFVDSEDRENARRILCREISVDEMVNKVILKHGYNKNL